MKICITSSGKTLQSKIDPLFGRAKFFIVYDTKTKEKEIIKNPYTDGGGAGTKASQLMIDKNIKLVISGDLGPNAKFALNQAGIKFQNADLTKSIEENINDIAN
jgi:predicted Fe-Mo cluster-binding NifX family protein